MGPRTGVDVLENRRVSSFLPRIRTADRPGRSLVSLPITLDTC